MKKPLNLTIHPNDQPRKDGTWSFLYHVSMIGGTYIGCIRAKSPTHALSEMSKIHKLSQINLRAEEVPNSAEKIHGKHRLRKLNGNT